MALLPGGPPPIGEGNLFTGVSKSLEFIGNHVYGYSGSLESTTTTQVAIDYNNGSKYLVLDVQFCGAVKYDVPGDGAIGCCKIQIGGGTVALMKAHSRSSSDQVLNITTTRVILPPYANLKVEVISAEDTAEELVEVLVTGRVYT